MSHMFVLLFGRKEETEIICCDWEYQEMEITPMEWNLIPVGREAI